MLICHKLFILSKFFKRFFLKHSFVAFYIAEYFRFKNHKSGVNHAPVAIVFFTERFYFIIFAYFQNSKLLTQIHSSDCRKFFMFFMKFNKFAYIYIRNSISVSKHKCFISDKFTYPFNTAACHRIETCVNNSNSPWLRKLFMHYHIVFIAEIECNIAVMKKIIGKPFFNNMLLISRTNYKIIKSIVGISLHDMP